LLKSTVWNFFLNLILKTDFNPVSNLEQLYRLGLIVAEQQQHHTHTFKTLTQVFIDLHHMHQISPTTFVCHVL